MRRLPSISMSRGDILRPCLRSDISSNGCTAMPQSMTGRSTNTGFIPPIRTASSAFARIKSISPRKSYACKSCGTWGRNSAEKADRMAIISRFSSASSSRMRLFASTTSAGSMKTVLPLADSSCTIPPILRFSAGATGITRRPSRIVGEASFSTNPSAWARRRMLFSVRDMLPEVRANSPRMRARAGEALSLTAPNLSIMESMSRIMRGNASTSPARARSEG